MLAITKATVPTYLQGSLLYKELSDDYNNDPIIFFPSQFCKYDDSIHSQEDLVHLCHTLRFWGVANLPRSIIAAAFSVLVLDWKSVMIKFGAELTQINVLLDVICKEENERIQAAVQACWLDLVDYLYNQSCKVPDDIVTTAASLGQRDIMEYFVQRGVFPSLIKVNLTFVAAKSGHVDCLQYAHELGCPWNFNVINFAAYYGHLDCLQYAYKNGCPLDTWSVNHAVMHGHMDCLAYLLQNGSYFDETATLLATENNQLNCLRYLHEHGCPWNPCCTSYAAGNSNLDILTYLHEHGCPWGEQTLLNGAKSLNLDCFMYALEHGCPWAEETLERVVIQIVDTLNN